MFDLGLTLTLHRPSAANWRRCPRTLPHPFDSSRNQAAVSGRTAVDCDAVGKSRHDPLSACRNREGCDVYIHPYAGTETPATSCRPGCMPSRRGVVGDACNGHEPCVVLQTSPGHWQAWVHISSMPLEPAVATALGRHLARTLWWRPRQYRLASSGQTRRVHQSKTPAAPAQRLCALGENRARQPLAWRVRRAPFAGSLASGPHSRVQARISGNPVADGDGNSATPASLSAVEARQIYQAWMRRWQIARRFPQPDWSIVDLWVARALLAQGRSPARVASHSAAGQSAISSWPRDPTTTCAAPWRALFRFSRPRGRPVCRSCLRLHRRPPPTAIVRTPPAAGSPAPSAAASGYRPSPGIARCNSAPRPGRDIPVDSTSSYFRVFMKDSQVALSYGFPLRLMLIRI